MSCRKFYKIEPAACQIEYLRYCLSLYVPAEAVLTFSGTPGFTQPLVTKGTVQNTLFTCSVEDNNAGNTVNVQFFAPGGSVPLQTNSKYTVSVSTTKLPTGQITTGHLFVANLIARDSGMYKCVANNSLLLLSKSVLLEVEGQFVLKHPLDC